VNGCPDSEYDNTEVIFEPIQVNTPRDDMRGFRHGEAATRRGFTGVVEEEEEEDKVVVIKFGTDPLPSDEELEAMKEQFRLEDAAKAEAEALKRKGENRVLNRIKALFGFGG
jgi:hypothetical protein